jgi:hypothetical protein
MIYSDDSYSKSDSGLVKNYYINFLNPMVRDSLARANVGDIVGPIETPAGIYLYKLYDKKKDTISFAQLLIAIKPSIETKRAYRDSLKNALKAKDITKFGFQVDTTVYIPVNTDYFPIIGENEELSQFIKKEKVGKFSRVFEVGNIIVSYKLLDRRKEGESTLDEIRNMLFSRVVAQKKKELLRKTISKISEYLSQNDTSSIRNLFNDSRVIIFETGLINPDMSFPGLPFNAKDEFFSRAFNTSLNKVDAFEHDFGFIVYKKIEDVPPDLKQFELQKSVIKAGMFQKNFQKLLSEFEKELKERYPLRDYRDFINERR